MARTYHRDSKGRFASKGSVNGSGGRISLIPGRISLGFGPSVRGASQTASAARQSVSGRKIQNIDTGRTISQSEAAAIMFGSAGRKKHGGKKVRGR